MVSTGVHEHACGEHSLAYMVPSSFLWDLPKCLYAPHLHFSFVVCVYG